MPPAFTLAGPLSASSRLALAPPLYGDTGDGGGGGFGAFLGNLAGDLKDAIYGIIPGTIHTIEHPIRSIEQIADSYAQTYGPLFKGHWGEFAHNLEEHPLGPILDLATVLDLGSSAAARVGLASAERYNVLAKYGDESAVLRETRGHPLSRVRGMAYQSLLDSPVADRLPFFNPESRYGAAMNREKRLDLANREIYARPFAKEYRKLDDDHKLAAGILANWTDTEFSDMAADVMEKTQAGVPVPEKELNVLETLRNNPKVRDLVENPTEQLDKVHALWHDLADYDKNLLVKYGDLTEEQAYSRRFLPNIIATGGNFYSESSAARDVEKLSQEMTDNMNKRHKLRLEMQKAETKYARGYGASQKRTVADSRRDARLRERINNWEKEAFGVDTEVGTLDNLINHRRLLEDTIPQRPEVTAEVFQVNPEDLTQYRRYEPRESPANRQTERDVAENGIQEPLVLSADPEGRVSLLDSEDNIRLEAARKAGLPSVPVRFERIQEHAPTAPGDFEPGQLTPEEFAGFNLDKPELRNVTDLHEGMVQLNQKQKRELQQEIDDLRQGAESYKQNVLAAHGKTREPVAPEPAPVEEPAAARFDAGKADELRSELDAIARPTLDDALDNWNNLTEEQTQQIYQFLDDETGPGGALTKEHMDENIRDSMGNISKEEAQKAKKIRQQATDVMRRMVQRPVKKIAEAPKPELSPQEWYKQNPHRDKYTGLVRRIEKSKSPGPASDAEVADRLSNPLRETDRWVYVPSKKRIFHKTINDTRGWKYIKNATSEDWQNLRDWAEWKPEAEVVPTPKPAPRPEPTLAPTAEGLPQGVLSRLDKIEADLQKELKPLLKKLESIDKRIETYSRGGGEKLRSQAEAEHRRHMEEIDKTNREIERVIKRVDKKVAAQVHHVFGMNELEKIADSLAGERELRGDLYYTRRIMLENATKNISDLAARAREIERIQPTIKSGYRDGWSEEQITNRLNERANETDNPYKANILRRGPAYMPITDFQRQKMHIGEQFTSLLGRMRGKAAKTGEAPSEHQVQGGSYPQAGIRSPVHQNRGTMLQLGRFILGQDTLTPQFMQTARYAYYRDLHAQLLAAAHEGERPGKGEVFVRRIRPTGDVEKISHIPLDEMRKLAREAKKDPFDIASLHEELLKEGNMATAESAAAEKGPNGRYMIVSKRVADAMMGEFKKADYFAQNLIEKPMTVWRHLVLNMSVRWLTNNALGLMMMYTLKNMGAHGLAAVLDVARQTKGERMVQQLLRDVPNPRLKQEINEAARVRNMGIFSQHAAVTREPRETLTQEFTRERQPGLGGEWVGRRFGGQMTGLFIQAQELERQRGTLSKFVNYGFSRAERWLEHKARMMGVNAAIRKHLDLPAFSSFAKGMDGTMKHIEDLADEQLDANPDLVRRINQEVNDSMGDFLSLNPVERRIIRRFMPFYAWYKAIGRVAWRLAVDDPLKLNIISRMAEIGNEAQKDQLGGMLPPYMRGALLFGGKDKPWMINTTSANPFTTINQMLDFAGAAVAGRPGEMGKPISQLTNPYLNAFIEAMSGRSLFFGNDVKGIPAGPFGNIVASVAQQTPPAQIAERLSGMRSFAPWEQAPAPYKSVYSDQYGPTEIWPWLAYLGVPVRGLNMAQLSGRLER